MGTRRCVGPSSGCLHKYTSKYRTAAFNRLKRDPKVREALTKENVRVRDAYKGITEEKQGLSPIGKIVSVFGGGTSE